MKIPFNSLKFKINFFIIFLIFISFSIFSLSFILSERERLSREVESNGLMFASFSTKIIYNNFVNYYTHNTEEDFKNFKRNILSVMNNNQDIVSLSLVSINGKVLFDSSEFNDGKYEGGDRFIENSEVLNLIKNHNVQSREIIEEGETFTEIISPLEDFGDHLFIVIYKLSNASLRQSMGQVYSQMFFVFIPLILIIFIVTMLFVRGLTKPIEVLVLATKKIRDGDLSVKTEISSNDEIGQLGVAFDEMATKLKKSYGVLESKIRERTRELEEERGSLEKKVFERTKELEDFKISLEKNIEDRTKNLNDKLLELERVNKLMIDRELRMIDLKKENQDLKTKLGLNN